MELGATPENYQQQMQRLLPRGPVWTRALGSTLANLLLGLADELNRLHARVLALLEESDPRTTGEMLADWERVVGVPDECEPDDLLPLPLRRLRVVQKLRARGGQTVQYFIDVADALGVPITIEEFVPAQFGQARFGERWNGPDWWFAWRVYIPGVVITPLRFGHGFFGDRFRDFGNDMLQCIFDKLKPAHTIVLYAFTPLVVDHGLITQPVGETIDYGLITESVGETVDHGLITEP